MASSNTAGALAIWHDIESSAEEAVLDWYSREHHQERVSVPGFVSARRWRATDGSPKFFIYYRVLNPWTLTSAPYLDRVNNPTPWTRQSMPFFRNNSRTVCSVTARHGVGEGGAAATIRLTPAADRAGALRQWLSDDVLPGISLMNGAVSAELWEAQREATSIHSEERTLRSAPDAEADWIIVLTGRKTDQIATISREVLAAAKLEAAGAAGVERGVYQLEYALESWSSHNMG